MNKDPTISAPVIGLCNNINPVIIATNGSRLDSIDAFEASSCLILLLQITLAITCTTIAVPNKRAQSEKVVLIHKGLSRKKANGIATIKPTIFEYKVIVSGSVLLESNLVKMIMTAKVAIVKTIQKSPLLIWKDDKLPFVTTK